MSDLDIEGKAPKKEVNTQSKPVEPELRDLKNLFQITPTVHQQGNELIAIVKMLESINRNLNMLAVAVFKHLNPEVKDGRPPEHR